jgi:hypothetical protein
VYKSICVAAILLPTFALAQDTKPTSAPGLPTPVIVAKGKLLNQTTTIPTTTIFTPTQTGLYRLSVYATVTKADSYSSSAWQYNFSFSDDAGPETTPTSLLWGYGDALGQFLYLGESLVGGTAYTFEAKVGTPVNYSVTQYGPADNSVYSVYYAIEKLE